MSPKEIAEKIISKLEIGDNFSRKETIDLARAYLELEKKLSLEQQDRESEKREFKVFKDAAENEITKLKEELNLGKSSLRCGQCGNIGMFHHGFAMADEIAKLKKSREVLRKAVEFYGKESSWGIHDSIIRINMSDVIDGEMSSKTGGKSAREAIKADDEIMK